MLRKFINVQPSDLKFPFQLNKMSTVWVELTNKIDHNVAFKVKTTHPKKYCVRPSVGLISPGSTCVIKVSMQAQKDFPVPLPKDKFLVQSMRAPAGLSAEDITSELFRKDKDNDVEELKLRVVFVTADRPSPIPEVSEEDFSPEAPEVEDGDHNNRIMALLDAATSACDFQDQFSKATSACDFQDQFSKGTDREDEEQIFEESESTFEPEEQLSQDWDRVNQLILERTFLMQENQELHYEMKMVRKQIIRSSSDGRNSIPLVLLACFLGFVAGYVIK